VRYIFRAALAVSVIGLSASLVVHIRSLLGFGFHHWLAFFGLILVLVVPYILACDGIAHGGATGWRKDPREYFASSTSLAGWLGVDLFEYQARWRTAFARRPPWLKRLDLLVNGYCVMTFIIPFFIKGHRGELSNLFSSTSLPASIVFVISSGLILFFWISFSTFWLVMQINVEP
jgi:hypothetical protein